MAIVIREFEAVAEPPARPAGEGGEAPPKPADTARITALLKRAAARRARLAAH